jgi:hypothetical protein
MQGVETTHCQIPGCGRTVPIFAARCFKHEVKDPRFAELDLEIAGIYRESKGSDGRTYLMCEGEAKDDAHS